MLNIFRKYDLEDKFSKQMVNTLPSIYLALYFPFL